MGIQGWDRVTLHILPSGLEAPAPGRGIASRPLHNVCVSSLSLDPGPFLLFGDPWELSGDTLPSSKFPPGSEASGSWLSAVTQWS